MGILFTIFKIIFIILAICILLICIPVKYKILASKKQKIRLEITIGFIFDILKFKYIDFESYLQILNFKLISLYRKKHNEDKDMEENKYVKSDKKSTKENLFEVKEVETTKGKMYDRTNDLYKQLKDFWDMIENYKYKKQFFEESKDYFIKLYNMIKFRKFMGYIKVSTKDPATTGKIAAVFATIEPFFNDIIFETEFKFEDNVEGEIKATGRIIPISIIISTIRYYYKKPVRLLIKYIRNK